MESDSALPNLQHSHRLAPKRSLGNHKDSVDDLPRASPYVRSIANWLVLASDGIWDVLTNQEVAEILHQHANKSHPSCSSSTHHYIPSSSNDRLDVSFDDHQGDFAYNQVIKHEVSTTLVEERSEKHQCNENPAKAIISHAKHKLSRDNLACVVIKLKP